MGMGVTLLYQIPKVDPVTGEIVKAHFGGSGYALSKFGFDTDYVIWVGMIAILANLVVAVVVTLLLRALRVSGGVDGTRQADYFADAGDEGVTGPEPETDRWPTEPVVA